MVPHYRRFPCLVLMFGLAVALSGCDARFTADLATDPPADPDIRTVQVNLRGLEFQRSEGVNETLEFRAAELVDLLSLRTDANLLRLFTDEQLPVGTYTGVRLLFDKDQKSSAVLTTAGKFPLQFADAGFAAVDFKVEKDKRAKEVVTLVLDLRQSLGFDATSKQYTLTPRVRSVTTAEAARLEGAVTASCPTGTTMATGGALYLFAGKDVVPDDLDGAEPEPYATTSVTDPGTGQFQYALRFLQQGNYTLALTCKGNQDALGTSDKLDFGVTSNVSLKTAETQQHAVE